MDSPSAMASRDSTVFQGGISERFYEALRCGLPPTTQAHSSHPSRQVPRRVRSVLVCRNPALPRSKRRWRKSGFSAVFRQASADVVCRRGSEGTEPKPPKHNLAQPSCLRRPAIPQPATKERDPSGRRRQGQIAPTSGSSPPVGAPRVKVRVLESLI